MNIWHLQAILIVVQTLLFNWNKYLCPYNSNYMRTCIIHFFHEVPFHKIQLHTLLFLLHQMNDLSFIGFILTSKTAVFRLWLYPKAATSKHMTKELFLWQIKPLSKIYISLIASSIARFPMGKVVLSLFVHIHNSISGISWCSKLHFL